MTEINSKMTLAEKLRAHANDLVAGDHTCGCDIDAAWCMRDAANVIDALNATIYRMETNNDRLP